MIYKKPPTEKFQKLSVTFVIFFFQCVLVTEFQKLKLKVHSARMPRKLKLSSFNTFRTIIDKLKAKKEKKKKNAGDPKERLWP